MININIWLFKLKGKFFVATRVVKIGLVKTSGKDEEKNTKV